MDTPQHGDGLDKDGRPVPRPADEAKVQDAEGSDTPSEAAKDTAEKAEGKDSEASESADKSGE